jgi:chromosome partitioning protein
MFNEYNFSGGRLKTIAFHVEKGGVGKTTMVGNVAYEISHYKKTLMVDGDPQGNLTGWYVTEGIERDLSDVMLGQCTLDDAVLQIRDNLYLLPTIAIDGELKPWSETQLPGKPFAFQDLQEELDNLGFEVVVFDLGPGISMLEKAILSTVNEVVGVVAAETFSVDGLEIFENELGKLRRDRRAEFIVDKLVLNRVNRAYALHNAYVDQFERLRYTIYQIGQSTGISDCVPYHKSIFEYDPGNRNTTEFQRIAKELLYVRAEA